MKIYKIAWTNDKQRKFADMGGPGGPMGPEGMQQPMNEDEAIEMLTKHCENEESALALAAGIIMQNPEAGLTLLGLSKREGLQNMKKVLEKEIEGLKNMPEQIPGLHEQIEKMRQPLNDPNALMMFLKELIARVKNGQEFKDQVLSALGLSADEDYLKRIKENIPLLVKGPKLIEEALESKPQDVARSKEITVNNILDQYNEGNISKEEMDEKMNNVLQEFAKAFIALRRRS